MTGIQRALVFALILCVLLSLCACKSTSFLALEENYGTALPNDCVVKEACIMNIGVDMAAIYIIERTESSFASVFRWTPMDDAAKSEVSSVLDILQTAHEQRPLENISLTYHVRLKMDEYLYYKLEREQYNYVYILFDEACPNEAVVISVD